MKIHKVTLQLTDRQSVKLPVGAKILSVQVQNGEMKAWFEFDERETRELYRFIYIVGTGHLFEIEEPYKFIGTVQMGPFVWHIYEKEIAP